MRQVLVAVDKLVSCSLLLLSKTLPRRFPLQTGMQHPPMCCEETLNLDTSKMERDCDMTWHAAPRRTLLLRLLTEAHPVQHHCQKCVPMSVFARPVLASDGASVHWFEGVVDFLDVEICGHDPQLRRCWLARVVDIGTRNLMHGGWPSFSTSRRSDAVASVPVVSNSNSQNGLASGRSWSPSAFKPVLKESMSCFRNTDNQRCWRVIATGGNTRPAQFPTPIQ